MDKQLIIRNTFVLIATVLTFLAAQLFLGTDNIILSIVVFLIGLFILNKNFNGSPTRIFFKIMFLTLFIGIAPYIANMNMFIGLPINFLSIFMLLYLLVYRLKKSIYFPFLLGYTLLLCVSPSKHYFYLRLIALTVIGLVAFVIQIFINKKLSNKTQHNNLNCLFKKLYGIVDDIIYDNESTYVEEFDEIAKILTSDLFETRNNNFYLKKNEDIKLNIISTLEKLKIDILKLNIDETDLEFIFKLKTSIMKLSKYSLNEINTTKLNTVIPNVDFLVNSDENTDYLIYEIEESIIIIKNLLIEFKISNPDKFNLKEHTIDFLELLKILKGHFNTNSVRFTFAFRTALTLSVTYFLIQYFDIHHGSWIIYTIASVSQPYNDTLQRRGIHRVKGTVLGAIYFLVLFSIFKDTTERYIILMATVYVNSFMKTYDKQITYITLLVLGLASTGDSSVTILSLDRIYMVLIGVVITLVSGRIIFPYYLSKETDYLIKSYYAIGKDIVDKLLTITKIGTNRLEIQNQTLLAKSIENKILINNTALDSVLLRDFLTEQRYLLTKAQSIINRVEYADISLQDNREERLDLLNQMKFEINNFDYIDAKNESIPINLEKYFNNISKKSEWLIYRDIFEILINANTCKELKIKLLKNKNFEKAAKN